MRRPNVLAGAGGIGFGVLTLVSLFVGNTPGGTYDASRIGPYLAPEHLPAVLIATLADLLGLVGLICLLAYLREAISVTPGNQLAASVFWGVGLTAVAAFAVGDGFGAASPINHNLGGSAASIAPAITYVILEVGIVILLGPAAMLMGFAMIVLMLGSRAILPTWLRWLTLIFGLIALASLAFIPFFILLIWAVVIGVWLVVAGRTSTSSPGVAAAG